MPTADKVDTVYDAFISYSHRDLAFAKWLEEQLEKYRPPKGVSVSGKRLNVFRDESDALAAPDLTAELKRHIGSSRFLIVVCSPDARRSRHVKDEIQEFIRTHGPGNVLCALCAGRPNQEVEAEDPIQDQSFPDAIFQPGKEPLAADFRKQTHASRPAKREEKLKIIAPLLDVQKGLLAQREREQSKRRTRRIIYIVSVLIGALVAIGLSAEFTAAGQFYQIRRSAHSYLSKGAIDGDARRAWALAQIRWGYDTDAEQTLKGIFNSVDKVNALTQAAEEWMSAGQREEADRAIIAASEANQKVAYLPNSIDGDILMAKVGYKIRGIYPTAWVLRVARRRSLRLPYANDTMDKMIEISKVFRAIGDSDSADEILEEAPELVSSLNRDGQSVAMRDLAFALAELGRFEDAERVARQIQDYFQKALAFAKIAGALNQAKRTQEARSMLNKANYVSAKIPDGYYDARAKSQIARRYVEMGMFRDAAHIARSIIDDAEKISVTKALCDAGAAEEALTVVGHPEASRADDWIGIQAASALAKRGEFARAKVIAESDSDPEARDFAMSEVAKGMAENGKLAEAEALAAAITEPYRKSVALAAVSYGYAKSGRAQEFDRVRRLAEDVALQISGASWKCDVFTELAGAAMLLGSKRLAVNYISQAADAAVLIHDSLPKSEAVNRLLMLAINNGMLRLARRIADKQSEDSRKIESLGQILLAWKTQRTHARLSDLVLF